MLTLLIGFSTACDDDRDGTDRDETVEGGWPWTNHETAPPVTVDEGDGGVVLSIGTETRRLTPEGATHLRAALGEAVADRRAFVNTVGERRPDGSYVVRRRGSETTGNSVVFETFRTLCRLAGRLPATVDAETVGRERGTTGSRRHLVVWHLAEHPVFDYRVASRSPLRVRAADSETGTESGTSDTGRLEDDKTTGDD